MKNITLVERKINTRGGLQEHINTFEVKCPACKNSFIVEGESDSLDYTSVYCSHCGVGQHLSNKRIRRRDVKGRFVDSKLLR